MCSVTDRYPTRASLLPWKILKQLRYSGRRRGRGGGGGVLQGARKSKKVQMFVGWVFNKLTNTFLFIYTIVLEMHPSKGTPTCENLKWCPPLGAPAKVHDATPRGYLQYTWRGCDGASYCEPKNIHEPEILHPKKYLASKFSTPKKYKTYSTSILIYSIKQTMRPKKNTWQISWPKKIPRVMYTASTAGDAISPSIQLL